MEVLKKILKVSVSAALFLGPLFYFGGKAVPMVAESIEFTKKMSAKNQKNREDRLIALDQLTVNEHAAKATAEITKAPTRLNEISEDESTAAVSASDAPEKVAPEGVAPAVVEPKTIVIESVYDPSDEAKIKAMFIPETTKRAILENYRRTGILPEGLVADRKPATAAISN